MFGSTGNWGRYGVKRVRLDPLDSYNQQNGSRKSLLARLNSAGEEKSNAPATLCPEKPRYIDVTAAFFGKQRRPAQESQGQIPRPSPTSPRLVQQQKPSRPFHQEKQNHDKMRRPVVNESPVAKELRDELAGSFATESSQLHNNGLTQLQDLYEALKGVMADMEGEDDRFLALVESNQKKMIKPPSETVIAESSSDEQGNTTRREVCIGEEVAAVGDLIQILETEVNQLWDAWEAAEREVQARLAELGGEINLPAGKNYSGKDVRQSLAEDMKAFGAEAEDIIEDSHEEARACEKEFGKKIHGAMSALLQQYLLED
ncbi:hypothetical protein INS49_012913 [Diaporthe citri]|uniref:uncharacterized protein n=1 Tax=Diaporthe citri TaxID=83186 RepID=UPI001C81523C|nr:uncharacterized protein INS49_012913 [Diaporthe citri]KAG6359392.1 hypothetical protein INS49_012913 [Diaporthe citri]